MDILEEDILMDTLEDNLREQRDPEFQLNADIIFPDDRDNNWEDVIVENNG